MANGEGNKEEPGVDLKEWLKKLDEEDERTGQGVPTATNWEAAKRAVKRDPESGTPIVDTTPRPPTHTPLPVNSAIGDGLDNSG